MKRTLFPWFAAAALLLAAQAQAIAAAPAHAAHAVSARTHHAHAAHERLTPRERRARTRRCRRRAHAWNRRHPHAKRHRCRRAHRAPRRGLHATHAAARGWGGFGPGWWPSAAWQPYAARSPFNARVGGASTHPDSAQLVARALQWGPPSSLVVGAADTSADYGHAVYYAQPTDPRYRLHATADWGRAPIEGMRIPVPAGARPPGGADGHMTIVTPDGWEYDLWQAHAPADDHTLTFSWGARVRIDGSGLGSRATASHFASLAGMIRPEELAAGHIGHALFIVLKCTGSGRGYGYGETPTSGSGSYVYPAQGGGSRCSDPAAPPMGTRFQLTLSDAQIDALALPRWKKAVLRALATYGGYVGDTGGSGFGFMAQSGSTYTSFGYADPFVALARASGASAWHGTYALDMADGVDWAHDLRVVVPPGS